MPRVLLTISEVRDALASLEYIRVGDEDCLDGEALLAVVEQLVPMRRASQPAPSREPDVFFGEGLRAVPDSPGEPAPAPAPTLPPGGHVDVMTAPTIEVAQALLNVAPRGRCVGCNHLDHFDGRCPECDCIEYVDSVVRDPMQYAGDKMSAGAGPPPWWPTTPAIESMISLASENADFHPGRLMHAGGPAQFPQPDNINPNPPSFQLPEIE